MNRPIQFSILLFLSLVTVLSCDREPIEPPEPVIERLSIKDLRRLYEEGVTTIDTNIYIQGIITLTPELKNLPAFVAYVQDSTAGICLTVSGDNTFSRDSEVKIFCRGASFTLYNGLLQFGDINIGEQTELVSLVALSPEPVTVTLDDLLAGKHQGEYVKLENVQFTETGKFSGTKVLTDCISEAEVYTRSDAVFASKSLPTGNGTFRGVASVYSDVQLLLREDIELEMTGDRCGLAGVTYLDEDFATLGKYADVSTLAGWKTYAEAGGRSWYGNEVSGMGKWVQATAYNSGQASVKTWMISPPLNFTLAVRPFLIFDSADGYDNGATLELMVSPDYAGSATPWTSNWTLMTFNQPVSNPSGYSKFASSGQVDLASFKGKNVYIAWVYTGSHPSKTTTWEIDNVRVGEK